MNRSTFYTKLLEIIIAFIAWSFVCYLMYWALLKSLEMYTSN